MKVSIDNYSITLVANSLEFRVVDTSDTEAKIYYCLRMPDGRVAEEGNKILPIAVLGILAAQPVNISALNTVLAEWNITATEQIPAE